MVADLAGNVPSGEEAVKKISGEVEQRYDIVGRIFRTIRAA